MKIEGSPLSFETFCEPCITDSETRLYQMTGKSCKFVYSSCHCVKNVVKSKLQIVPRLGVTVHTNSDHDVCVD